MNMKVFTDRDEKDVGQCFVAAAPTQGPQLAIRVGSSLSLCGSHSRATAGHQSRQFAVTLRLTLKGHRWPSDVAIGLQSAVSFSKGPTFSEAPPAVFQVKVTGCVWAAHACLRKTMNSV